MLWLLDPDLAPPVEGPAFGSAPDRELEALGESARSRNRFTGPRTDGGR